MCASHNVRRLILLYLLLFPLSVLVAGCGGEGVVSGKVYFKDQPVKGGTVYFFPENKSGPYQAPIGEDGTYSVSKVPPGPAKISVMPSGASAGPPASVFQRGGREKRAGEAFKKKMTEETKKELEEKAKSTPTNPMTGYSSPVPEKYSNPETSGLTLDVKGGRQTHDIKLD